MLKFVSFENHTHTRNSDADFTVQELVEAVEAEGYAGMSLTDHNTFAGEKECERLCKEKGLVFIKGIEWTTYFGHMLVLNAEEYVDWKNAVPSDIDYYIDEIHKVSGIVGIAHPFALSDPIATGYHWAFDVKDYSKIDYIEVCSKHNGFDQVITQKAFAFWEKLLLEGKKPSAMSGRDWHRLENIDAPFAKTYFGFEGEINRENAIKAIKESNLYVTFGPEFNFDIRNDKNERINIGSSNESKYLTFDIEATLEDLEVEIVNNCKIIDKMPLKELKGKQINVEKGFVRLDFNKDDKKIAFINPIYIV